MTTVFVPSVGAEVEAAYKADDFVDSIGVNTHLFAEPSVYHQQYNEIIKPKLLELGVRHIRDKATPNTNGYLDRLKELGNLGVRSTLFCDPRWIGPQKAADLVKELGVGVVVDAVQGPNEYNLSGDSNWVDVLRTYQSQLYQIFKADSATSRLPIVGPSMTSDAAYQAVGDLNPIVDYIGLHQYFAGRHPGTSGWGDNGYGSINWYLTVATKYSNYGSKIPIVTETGYNNTINTPSTNKGVPEAIAAKYIQRSLLELFNAGVKRSFLYEFIDYYYAPNDKEYNFGLLRNDGSEKPAFVALKNLIALLKNPGVDFTPGSLDYVLSGNTNNVHRLLLQKGDGKFYLILWQEVPSYDVNTKEAFEVPRQLVKLTLNTPIALANIYMPTVGSQWNQQYTFPQQIEFEVPDEPVVVELLPNSNSWIGAVSGYQFRR